MTLRTKRLLARLAHASAPRVKVIFSHKSSQLVNANAINICVDKEEDCGFMRHLCEVHGAKWARAIHDDIWTVLHEVGHYHTYSKYADSKYEYAVRMKFEELTFDYVNRSPKVQDIYYNLPSEYVATEFAIDFVKRHYKLMKKLSVLLSKDE